MCFCYLFVLFICFVCYFLVVLFVLFVCSFVRLIGFDCNFISQLMTPICKDMDGILQVCSKVIGETGATLGMTHRYARICLGLIHTHIDVVQLGRYQVVT